jgi:hypothetical protein
MPSLHPVINTEKGLVYIRNHRIRQKKGRKIKINIKARVDILT